MATMNRRAGFTLIELLVVISILALLVVAFVPDLVGVKDSANVKDTEGRRLLLDTGIKAFTNKHGWLPPDDLVDPDGKIKVKNDNGINTGIESLVLFLSMSSGGIDLSEHTGWLANTDKDDNGAPVPRLNTNERREIVDAWDTPFAFFSSTTAGSFDRPQKIRVPGDGGMDAPAVAWKGPDGHLGARKYQLVSAGKDQIFNTEDDVVWPDRK
jgi:prepilin-type N-terminal cleavage/methylation domain-containing protein